jgi:PAS domain S-box-containing protein
VADDYFRLMCDHTDVALVAADMDLNIVAWNRAAAQLFGAGADQMVGTSLLSVIPGIQRAAAEKHFLAAVRSGDISHFEYEDRDEHGCPRELAASAAPLNNEEGDRIGAVACIDNISPLIRLRERLSQTKKMASLGQMAGALAHYFNNILGGIVTSVDYALATEVPSVKDNVLQMTAKNLGRATKLMEGLLAFAEGDQRNSDLNDLTECLIELVEKKEEELTKQGIDLLIEFERIPVVAVPRAPMMTILRNIVSNAVEAMPDGGRLRLKLETDGEHARVTISDSGAGMSPEQLTRIFEPFFTTKTEGLADAGEHTGLGLAVSHGLVHMMGGEIRAESVEESGSLISIHIPLQPKDPPDCT